MAFMLSIPFEKREPPESGFVGVNNSSIPPAQLDPFSTMLLVLSRHHSELRVGVALAVVKGSDI